MRSRLRKLERRASERRQFAEYVEEFRRGAEALRRLHREGRPVPPARTLGEIAEMVEKGR